MDSVEKFAREAAAFERWLLSGTDREADAARECLIRLLELYRAGMELPPEWSDELEGRADVERVGDAAAVWEWSFGLHAHWGAHATGAMRAPHWWLCDNSANRLPSRGAG